MKTYPIIFSDPMVRALLDSRKVQTRRLPTSMWANLKMHHDMGAPCAVWVRETFSPEILPCKSTDGRGRAWYRADSEWEHQLEWKPSIHMHRWASRLTLEVTEVRLQCLQAITEEDAIAEGATSRPSCHGFGNQYPGLVDGLEQRRPEVPLG